MVKRFPLVMVWIVAGFTAAIGQTDQPTPRHDGDRARAPVRRAADLPPPQKEWVEQAIDKFLAIPDEIFDSKPARQ